LLKKEQRIHHFSYVSKEDLFNIILNEPIADALGDLSQSIAIINSLLAHANPIWGVLGVDLRGLECVFTPLV